jgi:hypothetical protein
MPDLNFQVESAEAVPYAAAPLLALKLRISAAGAPNGSGQVHTVALRCQVRIETPRRKYSPAEQQRLKDLFGEPARWGQTLKSVLWTNVSTIVPRFAASTVVDLQLPCSFDFNVATTRYFDALEDGEVPLCLLFSGTIFHEAEDGSLQVAQVPWEKEAAFRLPVGVWKEMMSHYYPNSAWLCLRKDIFDQLQEFKTRNSLPTWEQALERLLSRKQAEAGVTTQKSLVRSSFPSPGTPGEG